MLIFEFFKKSKAGTITAINLNPVHSIERIEDDAGRYDCPKTNTKTHIP